ncbi:uncharacterized protein MONOS_3715 [Monocercomonoides exilis]|uniref:uncharacterized protein n=1 Tax=Monocercomonoides exilis TaxID=2049356 RepID=UPI003559CCDF|nr:hypothetical protein MONOS_3715 [Monocercomonoides exilis]|eukprot:MONOS_3715.1-p1 / transcript=MONOS_3715.1 / gene=MONOS_3715 / organism=Monocercomonoides_exilis_PA203 / gene_product=unspecified product / transcript_product=unspecified product / location=Mono_scaffold00090:69555-71991(+) / protein_length=690 / sequence_SO=supercontig / SO=protein_coding / is_pseudo=false
MEQKNETPKNTPKKGLRVMFDMKQLKEIEEEKKRSPYGTMQIDDPKTPGRPMKHLESPLSTSSDNNSAQNEVQQDATASPQDEFESEAPKGIFGLKARSPEEMEAFRRKRDEYDDEFRVVLAFRKQRKRQLIRLAKALKVGGEGWKERRMHLLAEIKSLTPKRTPPTFSTLNNSSSSIPPQRLEGSSMLQTPIHSSSLSKYSSTQPIPSTPSSSLGSARSTPKNTDIDFHPPTPIFDAHTILVPPNTSTPVHSPLTLIHVPPAGSGKKRREDLEKGSTEQKESDNNEKASTDDSEQQNSKERKEEAKDEFKTEESVQQRSTFHDAFCTPSSIRFQGMNIERLTEEEKKARKEARERLRREKRAKLEQKKRKQYEKQMLVLMRRKEKMMQREKAMMASTAPFPMLSKAEMQDIDLDGNAKKGKQKYENGPYAQKRADINKRAEGRKSKQQRRGSTGCIYDEKTKNELRQRLFDEIDEQDEHFMSTEDIQQFRQQQMPNENEEIIGVDDVEKEIRQIGIEGRIIDDEDEDLGMKIDDAAGDRISSDGGKFHFDSILLSEDGSGESLEDENAGECEMENEQTLDDFDLLGLHSGMGLMDDYDAFDELDEEDEDEDRLHFFDEDDLFFRTAPMTRRALSDDLYFDEPYLQQTTSSCLSNSCYPPSKSTTSTSSALHTPISSHLHTSHNMEHTQ